MILNLCRPRHIMQQSVDWLLHVKRIILQRAFDETPAGQLTVLKPIAVCMTAVSPWQCQSP